MAQIWKYPTLENARLIAGLLPAYTNQKTAVLQLFCYSGTRKRPVWVNLVLFKLDVFLLAVSAQKNSVGVFLVWVGRAVNQRAISLLAVSSQKNSADEFLVWIDPAVNSERFYVGMWSNRKKAENKWVWFLLKNSARSRV